MNKFELHYINITETKSMELTLERIDNALNDTNFNSAKLGKVIHIAGTNGKGSTSYFLAQMLEYYELRTAMFTSPHILKVNERISFRLWDIIDNDFDKIFEKYKDVIDDNHLSYFEALLFIALMWFSSLSPDVTILETGLGGKFDATNTNAINDKLCVITSMSQDHADILGNNIYKIIDEKLGIIRNNSHVIIAQNSKPITDYIMSKCSDSLSIEHDMFADNNYPYPYSQNYATAKTIATTILNEDVVDFDNLQLLPCRQEKITPHIMLDGSHNASGIITLLKSDKLLSDMAIVVSFTKERNSKKLIELLSNYTDKLIITTIPNNERSITVDEVKGFPHEFIKNPLDAINTLRYDNRNVLVVGSFYLCAYVKENLDELNI